MPSASILYLHGFASGPQSAKAVATKAWADARGIPIAVPDLNGEGFRTLTIASQLEIARAHLKTLHPPVVAVGSSLGGYVSALLVDAKVGISAALLLAPAFDFARRFARALGPEVVKMWREQGVVKVYHHSEKAEREVGIALIDTGREYNPFPDMSVPCTIVHGTRDTDVPVELSRLYVHDNIEVKLVELDDDHTLGASIPRCLTELEALIAAVAT